uniref:Fe-S protein assembly co-chaperone HscB n=1 Tax=Acidobacterium capsulatum TaxID=33075 RepID=A0A7V4XT01_9BACT
MQNVTTSVSGVCWSCGQTLEGSAALCAACGKVQPVISADGEQPDYFRVFGLTRKLALDTAALERSFYRHSRKLHPDVYARASAEEQLWSLDQTSLLNDAYRTLKNPVARTEYLLKLEGKPIASEEQQAKSVVQPGVQPGATKEARVPADMLEEVFELNMQLEEMRMNRKMGEDDPALRGDLEKARLQFEAQLAAVDDDLKSLWQQWDEAIDADASATAEPVKDKMFSLLDRRRYIRNLVRDVNDALGS